MYGPSAVEFATPSRVHIALSVRDTERSATFYQHLFAQEPTKVRPHYAKFEVAEPPVNLTLHTDAAQQTRPGPSTHFGVQVKSSESVAQIAARLRTTGLNPRLEDAVSCCYAVQDKVWVTDPDGNAWRFLWSWMTMRRPTQKRGASPTLRKQATCQIKRSCKAPRVVRPDAVRNRRRDAPLNRASLAGDGPEAARVLSPPCHG